MTLDCSGLQNGQSRVISFLKRRYGGQLGPLFCCLGSVLQQQGDQWDGHQAEQAGEKNALGGKLRVAAIAFRKDRSDSGAGHRHNNDDHPRHQGIGDWTSRTQVKTGRTRRRRREAERTSRSRRMPDSLWPTRFMPMTTMDSGVVMSER